jgi:GT2 family glycosyltransferase
MVESPLVIAQVLNYDNELLTIECIESLLRNDYPNLRILLVDNGSKPASLEALRTKFLDNGRVRIVHIEKNRGYAGGNNWGLERVRELFPDARYLYVSDNDTVHDRDLVSTLVRAAQSRPDFAVIGPKICPYSDRDRVFSAGGYVSQARGEGILLHQGEPKEKVRGFAEVAYVEGAAMLIRMSALSEGFLDERLFTYWEETDFQYRLRSRGHRIGCCADTAVYHRVAATTPRNAGRRSYYIWRNRIVFHRRWSSGLLNDLSFHIVTFFVWIPGIAILQIFKRRRPGIIKFCFWAVMDGYTGEFGRNIGGA